MPKPNATAASVSLFLLGLGVVIFVSPLTSWWLERNPPWYVPFLAWLGFIGLVVLMLGRRGQDDV